MNSHVALAIVAIFAAGSNSASAQAAWRVDAAPTLDLSSSTKSGTVLFARVTSATRLQDGTIVVADRDDNALHYFDAAGKPLRTAGRAGSGPGEFRNLAWMGRCSGDSVHVWDFSLHRMAVFAPNGAFDRQYALPSDTAVKSAPTMTLACSPAGVIAFQGQPVFPKVRTPPKDPAKPTREERAIRTAAQVSMANTGGKVGRQFGELPSGSMYVMGGGWFPLPLASTTYVAVAGHRIFIGVADSNSTVVAVTQDGAPHVIKLTLPARPTTAQHRDRAAVAMASLAPAQLRKMAEDSLKLSPMPAMLPPYSGLFGDTDGVLWVQVTVPGDANTRLRAIGPNDQTLGEVTLPANVVIHEVGRDYILGAYDDADDVPHLVMFRLHRGR